MVDIVEEMTNAKSDVDLLKHIFDSYCGYSLMVDNHREFVDTLSNALGDLLDKIVDDGPGVISVTSDIPILLRAHVISTIDYSDTTELDLCIEAHTKEENIKKIISKIIKTERAKEPKDYEKTNTQLQLHDSGFTSDVIVSVMEQLQDIMNRMDLFIMKGLPILIERVDQIPMQCTFVHDFIATIVDSYWYHVKLLSVLALCLSHQLERSSVYAGEYFDLCILYIKSIIHYVCNIDMLEDQDTDDE